MIPYLLNLATLVGIFGILAASLNIMVGYAGIFSVAQAVFFGLGAYAGAQIALLLTTDLFVAILVAMAISAALSLCIALPSLGEPALTELDLEKRKTMTKEVEVELIKAYGAGIPYNMITIGNTLAHNYYHPTENQPFVTAHQFASRAYIDPKDPSFQGRPA